MSTQDRVSAAERPHTYASYLCLDRLLSCQQLQSSSHNELLFITIHQVKELWFKLVMHELEHASEAMMAGQALVAHKMLDRVSTIEAILVHTWDIMQTLSPDEFRVFRPIIGREGASGFQSYQYRLLEFILGVKQRTRRFRKPDGTSAEVDVFDLHAADADALAGLEKAWRAPGLYDAAVHLLARRFPELAIQAERDYTIPYARSEPVFEAWKTVYTDVDNHMDLFQLAEKLVDVEDGLRQWRFRHVTTVSRIIGFDPGTGGSAGVEYLLDVATEGVRKPMFVELWEVRHALLQ